MTDIANTVASMTNASASMTNASASTSNASVSTSNASVSDKVRITYLIVIEGTDVYSIQCNILDPYYQNKITNTFAYKNVLVFKKNSEMADYLKIQPRTLISGVEPEREYTFKLEEPKYNCMITDTALIVQIV